MRSVFLLTVFGMIIIVACMCVVGCTSPRQIAIPDAKELMIPNVAEGEREGVMLRAIVLDENQVNRLLSVDVTRLAIVPVLFVISNQTEDSYLIRREHFKLQTGQLSLEPALPGRAAVLLCDSSGSKAAALAGYFIGILAAPSIGTAEKKEAASVEAHREVIFSEDYLSPSRTVTGYLFFESPTPLKKIRQLDLELRISGNTENLISIRLFNPYSPHKGE